MEALTAWVRTFTCSCESNESTRHASRILRHLTKSSMAVGGFTSLLTFEAAIFRSRSGRFSVSSASGSGGHSQTRAIETPPLTFRVHCRLPARGFELTVLLRD